MVRLVVSRIDLAALCGCRTLTFCLFCFILLGCRGLTLFWAPPLLLTQVFRERERELRKEGREVPSRVRLREGPIGVRITQGQPTIGYLYPWVGFRPPAFVSLLSCSSSCAIEALWAFPVFVLLCICCVRT